MSSPIEQDYQKLLLELLGESPRRRQKAKRLSRLGRLTLIENSQQLIDLQALPHNSVMLAMLLNGTLRKCRLSIVYLITSPRSLDAHFFNIILAYLDQDSHAVNSSRRQFGN